MVKLYFFNENTVIETRTLANSVAMSRPATVDDVDKIFKSSDGTLYKGVRESQKVFRPTGTYGYVAGTAYNGKTCTLLHSIENGTVFIEDYGYGVFECTFEVWYEWELVPNQIRVLDAEVIPHRSGLSITELFNETLDTGVVSLPHVLESDYDTEIKPFGKVIISDEYQYTKYMMISEMRKTVSKWNSNKALREYNFDLSLISPTIQLQRIVLPNRSVTHRANATSKTLWEVFWTYRYMYAPQFTIDPEVQTLFGSDICPEFQWNQPTLYEVFNDLLGVKNCVVTMKGFDVISFINLNAKGSEIDQNTLNNEEYYHSIEQYASEFDVDAKNMVSNLVNTRTFQSPKTLNSAILTTQNLFLLFENPIYSIDKVIVNRVKRVDNVIYRCSADITDFIVEESVYNLAKPSNSLLVVTGNYKRNRLYYREGGNFIGGLDYYDEGWLGTNTMRAVFNIIENAGETCHVITGTWDSNDGDIRNLWFEIEYTTIGEVKFRIEKSIKPDQESVLINNQQETYLNVDSFVRNQKQTIDRLGNEDMQIYGKFVDFLSLPYFGDTIGSHVLNQRTIAIYDSYIDFTATLTKDFVRKNLFTALNSRKRYTAYASAQDAFLSNHIKKIKTTISTVSGTGGNFQKYTAQYYDRNVNGGWVFPFVLMITYDSSEVAISNYVRTLGSTYVVGNSIVYHFRMEDNVSGGLKVVQDVDKFSIDFVKYVDDEGEFYYNKVIVYEGQNFLSGEYTTLASFRSVLAGLRNPEKTIGEPEDLTSNICIYESDYEMRCKDNREITAETLQFSFETDVPHIIISEMFIKRHPMAMSLDSVRALLKVYISTTQTYSKDDTIGLGTLTSCTLAFSNNTIVVTPVGVTWSNIVSWGICDENGKLLLGINSQDQTIYFKG